MGVLDLGSGRDNPNMSSHEKGATIGMQNGARWSGGFTTRNHRPHSLTTSEVGAIGSTKNEEKFFCRLHKQSAKLMINVFCFV